MSEKFCDTGYTESRGRNIQASNSMLDFMHKQNNAAGIKFCESVGRLICNRPWIDRFGKYRGPDTGTATDDPANADKFMNAEPIIYPVNVYKIIDESPTHYRIDAFVHDDTNWNGLDPKIHNWVNEPWLFPKMCAENKARNIQNVMGGVDAFWLTLSQRSGAWVMKHLLVFPPDPQQYVVEGSRGVGYRLHGANWIMGLENGRQVYVRRVTKAEGVREYYGWHINARSVVPPAWFQ
ncbi:MAG: hypothetical protein IPF77_17090 [Gemmatimonadetes bacterium]|nr:hypothetical protein [Gemmatimonadota bacterium]